MSEYIAEYIVPVIKKGNDYMFDFMNAKPLIRCKDCKYYQHGRNADEWLWCMMNHHYTDEEKYCAWAEPKEKEK